MGGLYSLTQACIEGIAREMWGTKIQDGEGNMKDTGVQPFVDELLARLGSNAPIQMPDTLTLIAPQNGPAIRIILNQENIHGDGGIVIENFITENIIEENITNNTNVTENITVIGGGSGFSGTINVVTGATFNASVSGCTVTITPTFTYAALKFQNGLLQA